MPLDLIGAGVGRTGTRTLKAALEQLGVGPCYHMTDFFGRPEGLSHWEDADAGRPVDWEALFGEFRAVVDYPGCRQWAALSRAFPEARVLLSVRDPDAWYDSVQRTIFRANVAADGTPTRDDPVMRWVFREVWQGDFEGRFTDRAFAIEWYQRHNAAVREAIEPGRLLVYQVSEGWAPLCTFLYVPVPETPFPRLNTRQEFVARLEAMEAARDG